MHNDSRSSNSHLLSVGSFQEIDLRSHFPDTEDENQISARAIWLSVLMQNNPVLAITCSNESNNDQKNAFLILFEPMRSKIDGNVYWQEIACIPVKNSIDFLITNPENRNMFAGASTSGDLYVWNYNKNVLSSANAKVEEIFSKASEDSIVGISFHANNSLISCFSDGSLTIYKIVSKQNCIVDKTLKIEASKLKESTVTTITSISSTNEFVIGLLNGKIFLCTSTVSHGSTDPVVRELNSHKFGIKILKHCQMSGKNYVISCDTSSVIHMYEIHSEEFEKSTLKLVIALPLPMKNSLSVTNNMEYILCPLTNGGLEIFNTMTNTRRTLDGNYSGNGAISEISKNE